MRGKVYLGGGGSADDERPLWEEMLRNGPRVLYWPFALDGEMLDGADAWLRGNLAARWPAVHLTTWTSLDGHRPEELFHFHLLFVGGGNTFALLDHIGQHGFREPVRAFVAGGGSYYGGSAGAILAGGNIEIAGIHDTNDTDFRDFAGLGLVSDHLVLPHHQVDMEEAALEWSSRLGMPVIGIPERSGVLVDGALIHSLGYEPAAVIRPSG